MTPPRSQRLQPAVQLAGLRKDHAMKQLAQARGQLDQQEQRLAELRRYIDEYAVTGSDATTPMLAANRQVFLARLREAERYQQKVVEQARGRCDTQQDHWLSRRRDAHAFEQLAVNYLAAERRSAESRMQREIDEQSARRVLASAAGDPGDPDAVTR